MSFSTPTNSTEGVSLANSNFTELLDGVSFTLPAINLAASDYLQPDRTSNPLWDDVAVIDNAVLTEGTVDGSGVFDVLMSSIKAHLKQEYDDGRITGDKYVEAYIASLSAALASATQYAVSKDQAYWNNLLVQAQGRAAQIQAITAAVQLESSKVQYVTGYYQMHTAQAEFALTKMKTATEDAQYVNMLAQTANVVYQTDNLLTEQARQLIYQTDTVLPAGVEQTEAQTALLGSQKDQVDYEVSDMMPSQKDKLDYETQYVMPSQVNLNDYQREYVLASQVAQTEYETTNILPAQAAKITYEYSYLMPSQKARIDYEVNDLLPAQKEQVEFETEYLLPSQMAINDFQAEYLLPSQMAINHYQVDRILPAQADQIDYTVENLLPAQVAKTEADTTLVLAQELLTDQQAAVQAFQVSDVLPAQVSLLSEQMEAQRAQTLDTRSDGTTTVVGSVGKQKDLYDQQIDSYVKDAQYKVGKMYLDTWITQKTLDEGLTVPTELANTEIGAVVDTIRTNNSLD